MSFSIFAVLIIVLCVFLVVIIMVQNPKGGGLSSTFGGSQQMIGSVQKTNEFLDRATWTLSIAVAVLAILSSITLPKTSTGTYDEVLDATAPQTEMPLPLPCRNRPLPQTSSRHPWPSSRFLSAAAPSWNVPRFGLRSIRRGRKGQR